MRASQSGENHYGLNVILMLQMMITLSYLSRFYAELGWEHKGLGGILPANVFPKLYMLSTPIISNTTQFGKLTQIGSQFVKIC